MLEGIDTFTTAPRVPTITEIETLANGLRSINEKLNELYTQKTETQEDEEEVEIKIDDLWSEAKKLAAKIAKIKAKNIRDMVIRAQVLRDCYPHNLDGDCSNETSQALIKTVVNDLANLPLVNEPHRVRTS